MSKYTVDTLEEFLTLRYEVTITPFRDEDPEEQGYVAFIKELPGLEVFEKTIPEALDALEECKEMWFEVQSKRSKIAKPAHHYHSESNKQLRSVTKSF